MNCDYEDIRQQIAELPRWFDEAAVPRYVEFSPREFHNIYAREGVLMEIACQSCGMRFKVAMTRCSMDDVSAAMAGVEPRSLSRQVTDKTIHYGDPPNIGCCAAGPTMNSDPLRVLEFWRRDADTDHDWRRDPALEIDVSDETTG